MLLKPINDALCHLLCPVVDGQHLGPIHIAHTVRPVKQPTYIQWRREIKRLATGKNLITRTTAIEKKYYLDVPPQADNSRH
jgi:hypothetical protein